MRIWLVAGSILAALPAFAQEAPLALRRTEAMTQRPLELGVVAGFQLITGRGAGGDRSYDVPLVIELGVLDRLELHLLAGLYADENWDLAPGKALASGGGGVGVKLVSSPAFALSASADLTLPQGYDWVLTPAVDGALAWRRLLVEAGAWFARGEAPARGLAYCRAGIVSCAVPASSYSTLGGALAISWVAGAFVPGARFEAAQALASAATSPSGTTAVAVTPRRAGTLARAGPQLEVFLTDHALLRLALPIGVGVGTSDLIFLASLRVDAELAQPAASR